MLAACPMFGHFRGDVDLARVLCVGGTTKGVIWAGWTLPGFEKEGKVKAGQDVHHKNGDATDNRRSNIVATSRKWNRSHNKKGGA